FSSRHDALVADEDRSITGEHTGLRTAAPPSSKHFDARTSRAHRQPSAHCGPRPSSWTRRYTPAGASTHRPPFVGQIVARRQNRLVLHPRHVVHIGIRWPRRIVIVNLDRGHLA